MNERGTVNLNEMVMRTDLEKYLELYTNKDDQISYQFISLFISNSKMFYQLRYLLQFCQKLKQSVTIERDNLRLPSEQVKNVPELIIKEVKNVRRVREENIVCVANKLKVFVCKTMQKESSKLRYHYTSYTNLLKDQMAEFTFNEPVQKIRQEFSKIRNTFNVLSVYAARLYRHHPSSCVIAQSNANVYVSFYKEKLLFFRNQPLPFNGNILFVPLFFVKIKKRESQRPNFVHIENRYLVELYKENQCWETYCLELVFKDRLTGEVKYYSYAAYRKTINEISQVCSLLRKIRTFVYFSMIFNYLKQMISQNQLDTSLKRSLTITLKENLVLQINTQRSMPQDKTESNPKILTQFLKYFDQQNISKRAQNNKGQFVNNFISYMQSILCIIKYQVTVPEAYLELKPKYLYFRNQRVSI